MYTWKITELRFNILSQKLAEQIEKKGKKYGSIYPIPRGGYKLAIALSQALQIPIITNKNLINDSTLIVDDLIDSGKTLSEFPYNDKAVLFVKQNNECKVNYYVQKTDDWVQFPDEKDNEIETDIERILQFIGEDTNREGLIETPKRILKSYEELFSGYKQDPTELLKVFKEGSCKEMVILKNCEFYSTCEHHFLPFYGHISIGYVPNGKVVGISKLARLVDCFSRRLQIQERLVTQIADCIMENLQAKGVMVICEGVHFCMTSRGVRKQNSSMMTSAIRGVFEDDKVRNEFLQLIKM